MAQAAGHEVIAVSRTSRRLPGSWDVEHHAVDALDAEGVNRLLKSTRPDAVVDLLTAIPADINPRKLAEQFALTNRLRTEGTSNLLSAARSAGVERYVGESIAFIYRPGEGLATETAPIWGDDAPKQFRPVVRAVLAKEEAIREFGGVVLRLGHLCGPGTSFSEDGVIFEAIKAHKLPVVGGGNATFSFLPVQEAARAFLHALDVDGPAVLNVVDNAPVKAREWISQLAEHLEAKKPSRAPAFLARAMIGAYGVLYLNQMRGASNAAAKERLGWSPSQNWRTALLRSSPARLANGKPGARQAASAMK
jgi:nucleoside-diphosphate-sugar epimerase